jgi:predicted DNA-binding protein YlxM (UPF0122 family)
VNKDLKEWVALFLPTLGHKIAARYADGASLDEIAKEFKMNRLSIRNYLRPYAPTPDQLEKFRREYVRKVLASNPKK